MNNAQFNQRIQALLSTELPDPNTLIAQGRAIADDITLGRSLFCEELGVASEADYKAQCKQGGVITYHAHVGMGFWPATVEALRRPNFGPGYRLKPAPCSPPARTGASSPRPSPSSRTWAIS